MIFTATIPLWLAALFSFLLGLLGAYFAWLAWQTAKLLKEEQARHGKLMKEHDALQETINKANLDMKRYGEEASRQRNIIDMLREELQTANKDVERYVNENVALKDQVALLIQAAKQPAPIPARPGVKKKAIVEE